MPENTISNLAYPTTSSSGNINSAQTSEKQDNTIDQNGFLRLFIEALKNQDPLQPMSNGEMMEQLTQLTQIENTLRMKELIENLVEKEELRNPIGNYLDLIGKKVKVETENGFKEGEVLSIGKDGNNIIFELMNGETYNVSQIVGVSQF